LPVAVSHIAVDETLT